MIETKRGRVSSKKRKKGIETKFDGSRCCSNFPKLSWNSQRDDVANGEEPIFFSPLFYERRNEGSVYKVQSCTENVRPKMQHNGRNTRRAAKTYNNSQILTKLSPPSVLKPPPFPSSRFPPRLKNCIFKASTAVGHRSRQKHKLDNVIVKQKEDKQFWSILARETTCVSLGFFR